MTHGTDTLTDSHDAPTPYFDADNDATTQEADALIQAMQARRQGTKPPSLAAKAKALRAEHDADTDAVTRVLAGWWATRAGTCPGSGTEPRGVWTGPTGTLLAACGVCRARVPADVATSMPDHARGAGH